MAVLSQATLINAMDSHATMMMTASAVAVDISFPSRSKDVFPSLTMNFAHDSQNPHIDLQFHRNCLPSNQLSQTCITFKIESITSRCMVVRMAWSLSRTFAELTATHTFVMDSAVIMVIAANLVAVDNLQTRKMTSAYQLLMICVPSRISYTENTATLGNQTDNLKTLFHFHLHSMSQAHQTIRQRRRMRSGQGSSLEQPFGCL